MGLFLLFVLIYTCCQTRHRYFLCFWFSEGTHFSVFCRNGSWISRCVLYTTVWFLCSNVLYVFIFLHGLMGLLCFKFWTQNQSFVHYFLTTFWYVLIICETETILLILISPSVNGVNVLLCFKVCNHNFKLWKQLDAVHICAIIIRITII